jgi:hypothetical protein
MTEFNRFSYAFNAWLKCKQKTNIVDFGSFCKDSAMALYISARNL